MAKSEGRRMIILVPAPPQGHLTPMMQLGKALHSRGFSITVVQVGVNGVSSYLEHYPGFQFVSIPECVPQSDFKRLGPFEFLQKFNKTSKASFKNCIAQLLQQHSNDIACIIYDEFMYFAGAAAKEFKLPNVILNTQTALTQASRSVFNKLDVETFLVDMDMEDPELRDKVVENLYPLRYKDLLYKDLLCSGYGSLEPLVEFHRKISNKRTASAVIINTTSCLEITSLSWLEQELGIPVYPLGPLHITALAPSSLLEEDKSCIEWLDKHKPRSVIYISLGSLIQMETKEVLEMAWGLSNSNQPFLWAIRPGSIVGSEWIESLPEEVREMVAERGYIVKWAPQKDVLAHPAVGGFWSHCGWNSTLESIVEGVPMICRPFNEEQMLNALYIDHAWNVGIQLEGEPERRGIERAVKRLMVDEEGAGMRERVLVLKEELKASVRSGGSSYNALDELVKNLKTE